MFKAFLVIFSYVTSYEFKNLGWRQLNSKFKLLNINSIDKSIKTRDTNWDTNYLLLPLNYRFKSL